MSESQHRLDTKIQTMVKSSTPHQVIARRLFLYDFPSVFPPDDNRGFDIMNTVCEHFNLPFSSIKIAGSAQTGHSYIKSRDFTPGVSDLDLAIISSSLFQHYSQEIYWLTDRYTDLKRFPRKGGISVANDFRYYLSAGQLRPDLMPEGILKTNWFSFFNRLSNKHLDMFQNINAGIYLSEKFFEMKNASIVELYRKAKK